MQTIEDQLFSLISPSRRCRRRWQTLHLLLSPAISFILSGPGPKTKDGDWVRGQVGKDLTVQQAYEAARLTGIQILASCGQRRPGFAKPS